MANPGQPGFGSALNEPTRRAYFDLQRRLAQIEAILGITDGSYDLTLEGSILGGADNIVPIGGTNQTNPGAYDADNQLFVDGIRARNGAGLVLAAGESLGPFAGGIDNTTAEQVYIVSEGGTKFVMTEDNWASGYAGRRESVIMLSDGQVRDNANRQFIRSRTGVTKPLVMDYGIESGTVDALGRFTITFDQQFASTPVVVASYTGTALNYRARPRNVTTSTFQMQFLDASNNALASGSQATGMWMAIQTSDNI